MRRRYRRQDSARQSVATSRASLEAYRETLEQERRSLREMLGRTDADPIMVPDAFPEVIVPLADLPAQTLARRPDLKAAFLAIEAAHLRTDVAYKDLLPSISLQTSLQDIAENPSDALLTGPVWSLLGQLTAPLYRGGELRAAAEVAGYGAAEPHYQLSLTAQVSGRVKDVSPNLEPGARVADGQWLARLEDSDIRATVASAEYDLASARQALLEEEREQVQDRSEWKASGMRGTPESDLVLRDPQLATAQAAVVNAQAALDSARVNLDQTTILAPFDALVVARAISPGSYVQAGEKVATLYSTDRVEVAVALSARGWANLPDIAGLSGPDGPAVTLVDVASGQTWEGCVVRAEGHRSATTRQRNLIIAVDAPLDRDPTLLPGTFLQARVPGRLVDGLWKLPSAALSQRGDVWIVDADATIPCKAWPQPRRSPATMLSMSGCQTDWTPARIGC